MSMEEMQAAIVVADVPDDQKQETIQEAAQVKKLLAAIDEARDFDEPARKQYAKDRCYARGDSDNEVSVNRTGTSIDTLKCYYYAKDPDIDVLPAEQVDMPGEDAPVPPPAPPNPGDIAQAQAYQQAMLAYQESMAAYLRVKQERRKRKEADAAFCRTLELVISKLWKKAEMKKACREQVGSSLTVGPGWLKVTWQQQVGENPLVASQIKDAESKLAEIERLASNIAGNETSAPDADSESLRQQIENLQGQLQQVQRQGLAIDFVRAEDIQCAIGPKLSNFTDGSWVAHRSYYTAAEAEKLFPRLSKDQIKSATKYGQRKPVDYQSVKTAHSTKAEEAEGYSQGGEKPDSLCVWEMWNKDEGLVYTLIEGVQRHAREPYAPQFETERFYPFFELAFIEVDGERHPQSLVYRSFKLADELDRIANNKRIHRRRSLPGIIANGSGLDKDETKKLNNSELQELTVLNPTDPNAPLGSLFAPKPTAGIDPILYDTSAEEAQWELLWGVQQALQGSIQVAKTATEAEIAQTGFNARTSFRRDLVEECLGDIAQYTAEIALKAMSREDARRLAGPGAMWPEGLDSQDIDLLCTVQIRAGSSGKPDTAADRQAWGALLPVVQAAQTQVAQLRQASPNEVADKIEAIVEESVSRSGSRLDIERFIPQGNDTPEMPVAPQVPVAANPNIVPFPTAQGA